MNFYALIIGTEILNGRRIDGHFEFLKKELSKFGHELTASFIIKDDKELMKKAYKLVLSDKNSVLFSFGGIGSTPDDLTRAIAAEIFTSKGLVRHKIFEKDIIDKFGEKAYPHRIHMSDLPDGSDLLFNPINNMSGFFLQNRYFFTPGFPEMSHPMITSIIKKFFNQKVKKHTLTLIAQTSEDSLIHIMEQVPNNIELSSLPMLSNIRNSKTTVEISLCGSEKTDVEKYFSIFIKHLNEQDTPFNLI
ncbi:MAG: molybdopterin-binding protein [Sulfurimonas sp.]|nr:molybdopterin-binding protein [Sulfurimonas sp.]